MTWRNNALNVPFEIWAVILLCKHRFVRIDPIENELNPSIHPIGPLNSIAELLRKMNIAFPTVHGFDRARPTRISPSKWSLVEIKLHTKRSGSISDTYSVTRDTVDPSCYNHDAYMRRKEWEWRTGCKRLRCWLKEVKNVSPPKGYGKSQV